MYLLYDNLHICDVTADVALPRSFVGRRLCFADAARLTQGKGGRIPEDFDTNESRRERLIRISKDVGRTG